MSHFSDKTKIVVIGYPYTRTNFRAAVEALDAYFVLPKIWKIKKGKAEYQTVANEHLVTTAAPFYHSDYPIIGGLLKGWMPAFPLLLWKLKHKHNVTLVFEAHEPTLLTTLYHGIAAKLLGLKHIVFSWENIPFDKKLKGAKGIFHRLILSANLMMADGVVCGNQKCVDIFKKITNKPLALVPLAGLDPEKFRLQSPRQNGEKVTFVFAGAVDYRKGLHVLLPAFKRLLNQYPQSRLVIIGSGTYEQQIDSQIKELGLPVVRLPWVDHAKLIEVFSEADVFLYPSISHAGWEEQFGYSMAEASLMELPVIATKSGSIEEVVSDGETGLLVPESDEDALLKAMASLIVDQEKRKTMGQTGREFVIKNFSNTAVAQKFVDFFASIIK